MVEEGGQKIDIFCYIIWDGPTRVTSTNRPLRESCNSALLSHFQSINQSFIMPPPHRAESLSDDARLTSVSLSRTSGLSREQRGLGRLKLAQM